MTRRAIERKRDRIIARLRKQAKLIGSWDICVYCGNRNGFGNPMFHLHCCENAACEAKHDDHKIAGTFTCDCTYKYLGDNEYEYLGRLGRYPGDL